MPRYSGKQIRPNCYWHHVDSHHPQASAKICPDCHRWLTLEQVASEKPLEESTNWVNPDDMIRIDITIQPDPRPTGATREQLVKATKEFWEHTAEELPVEDDDESWDNLAAFEQEENIRGMQFWASWIVPVGFKVVPVDPSPEVWKTEAWDTNSVKDFAKMERLVHALTSIEVYPIIEFVLNEGLMAEQLVQDRMDYGIEYWRDELLRLLREDENDRI